MSNNPADWSTVPEENSHLSLLTKKVNGQTVQHTREESNQIYADWKANHEHVEVRQKGTFVEFKAILTEDEEDAITAAAMTNLAIKKWYDLAVATNEVDLGNATVQAGISAFVDAGLITQARADVILAHNYDAA
jgi:hypothetical protein